MAAGAVEGVQAVPHSASVAEALGLFEIYADELAHAAFDHGYPKETVHPRHGDRIMGDSEKARLGLAAHIVEKIAKTFDIGVVERRIHFVENANRRRIGKKDREDQRQRGQRLFATGQKSHDLRLFPWWPGEDFEPGFKRIVGFDQLKLGRAAAE